MPADLGFARAVGRSPFLLHVKQQVLVAGSAAVVGHASAGHGTARKLLDLRGCAAWPPLAPQDPPPELLRLRVSLSSQCALIPRRRTAIALWSQRHLDMLRAAGPPATPGGSRSFGHCIIAADTSLLRPQSVLLQEDEPIGCSVKSADRTRQTGLRGSPNGWRQRGRGQPRSGLASS